MEGGDCVEAEIIFWSVEIRGGSKGSSLVSSFWGVMMVSKIAQSLR